MTAKPNGVPPGAEGFGIMSLSRLAREELDRARAELHQYHQERKTNG
jgi:hypothetical protein